MVCDHESKVYKHGETVQPMEKCRSKFIDAISGGAALPYGNGGKLELHTNNMDLNAIRDKWDTSVEVYDDKTF